MNVTEAFNAYQKHVNATKEEVAEASRLGGLFDEALGAEGDVAEVFASGSFARWTHKRPIHDLDLVVVLNEDNHPTWGLPGSSAAESLSHTGKRVNVLLGETNGSVAKEIRRADPRNHAVKCFRGEPGEVGTFTVDVMPAFRRDGMLLVPEAASSTWIRTNPEYLIAKVWERQQDWNRYQGTVRILKGWAANCEDQNHFRLKSLVMEVLALTHLDEAGNRPAALKAFFTKAAWYINNGGKVVDPAGVCGDIQSDLDYETFGDALEESASLAARAISAAANNDQHTAVKLWGTVFGAGFPDPPPAKPSSPGVVPPPGLPGQGDEAGYRPIKDTNQG